MDDDAIKKTQVRVDGNVQAWRDELLKWLLSPESRFLVRQRDVIKALLPEIRAARDMGASFEKIAEVLHPKGLRLKGDTIRDYFYEEIHQQDVESIHQTAERYKKAAEEAARRFQESSGKNLDDIVREAVDAATSRNRKDKDDTAAGAAGAAATAAANVSGSGGGGNRGPARAAAPPAVREGKKVVDEQQSKVDGVVRSSSKLDAILRRNIDPRDIPRRPD